MLFLYRFQGKGTKDNPKEGKMAEKEKSFVPLGRQSAQKSHVHVHRGGRREIIQDSRKMPRRGHKEKKAAGKRSLQEQKKNCAEKGQ